MRLERGLTKQHSGTPNAWPMPKGLSRTRRARNSVKRNLKKWRSRETLITLQLCLSRLPDELKSALLTREKLVSVACSTSIALAESTENVVKCSFEWRTLKTCGSPSSRTDQPGEVLVSDFCAGSITSKISRHLTVRRVRHRCSRNGLSALPILRSQVER